MINGFLESGKTEFITYTLAQPYFQVRGKTLLLLCEEGENEYDIVKIDPAAILRRHHSFGPQNHTIHLIPVQLRQNMANLLPESGKTEFITYTLAQPYFQVRGRTLLLLCEEGENEYDAFGNSPGFNTIATNDTFFPS